MDHLADAPIANILILAGVIFLAVGLFGRIGGFIGSIFGNIEAGKNSRVLAGLLGGLLILGGAWMHQQSDKSEKAASSHPATEPAAAPAVTAAGVPAPTTAASTAPAVVAPATTPKKQSPAVAQPLTPAADRANLPASQPTHFDDRLIADWTNVIPQNGAIAKVEIIRTAQGLDAHIWHRCDTGDCDYGIHPLAISGNTCTYEFTKGNRHYVGTMRVFAPNVLLLSADADEPSTSRHQHHNRVLTNSNLSGKTQVALSRYLDSTGQKAFAMTPAGAWSLHSKSDTAEEATNGALKQCLDRGWRDCRVILLNDEGPQ